MAKETGALTAPSGISGACVGSTWARGVCPPQAWLPPGGEGAAPAAAAAPRPAPGHRRPQCSLFSKSEHYILYIRAPGTAVGGARARGGGAGTSARAAA